MNFLILLCEQLDMQLLLQERYLSCMQALPQGSLWTKCRKDGNQYYLKLPGLPPRYLNKEQNSLFSLISAKNIFR